MKKIIFSLAVVLASVTVVNASSLLDGAMTEATDVVKEKATEKATDMAKDQAKKSLTDGSMKDKAIEKATEVADEHTDGKASQALEAVKSFKK